MNKIISMMAHYGTKEDNVIKNVGLLEVTGITEHCPQGEGDRHWCDVEYSNGTNERYFNVDYIKRSVNPTH